ncbi:MAG: LamG domain-containing protein [bacterium]|nr:LamG domain-containing protein [bacterium]
MKAFVTVMVMLMISLGPVQKESYAMDTAREFTVDEHTLFLAHYNDGLDADYARGMPLSTGNMALTAGLFGRGIDARRGLVDQNNVFCSPFFRMIRYDHQKNFDINEGTLEMWVKPSFSQVGKLTEPVPEWKGNDYYLFHIAISPGNKDIGLYIREWMTDKGLQRKLSFREMWTRETKDTFITEAVVSLNAGEWYHIAVAWSCQGRAIYLNGKKTAVRLCEGGLPSFGPSARPMAIGSKATYSARPAEAVIDEVRISNIIRY